VHSWDGWHLKTQLLAVGLENEMSEKLAGVDDITEAMKDVIDPELGINVVDLGLIYDVSVDSGNVAVLDMTLTSAACPLQDVIEDQTRSVLQDLVSDVKINWVWMPPWGPGKITDDGREQLRAIGFTV
jgi:metal-sulfur cluster biosynthetic enzyme